MIEYDQRKLSLKDLLSKLLDAEKALPVVSSIFVSEAHHSL